MDTRIASSYGNNLSVTTTTTMVQTTPVCQRSPTHHIICYGIYIAKWSTNHVCVEYGDIDKGRSKTFLEQLLNVTRNLYDKHNVLADR